MRRPLGSAWQMMSFQEILLLKILWSLKPMFLKIYLKTDKKSFENTFGGVWAPCEHRDAVSHSELVNVECFSLRQVMLSSS